MQDNYVYMEDSYAYMQGDFVYMQDNHLYIITSYFFHTRQIVFMQLKNSCSDAPSGPP